MESFAFLFLVGTKHIGLGDDLNLIASEHDQTPLPISLQRNLPIGEP